MKFHIIGATKKYETILKRFLTLLLLSLFTDNGKILKTSTLTSLLMLFYVFITTVNQALI